MFWVITWTIKIDCSSGIWILPATEIGVFNFGMQQEHGDFSFLNIMFSRL